MNTIVTALSAVMNDVSSVAKGDRNASQGFNFRGIDAVVNAVGPALRKHGVVVVPDVQDYVYSTVEIGKNRTSMGHVRVTVAYVFHGPDGSSITATTVGEAMDSGDKATAKAMSVAFRTALLQALCLPTDEPDPDHDVYERGNFASSDVEAIFNEFVSAIDSAPNVEVLRTLWEDVTKSSLPESRKKALQAQIVENKPLVEA